MGCSIGADKQTEPIAKHEPMADWLLHWRRSVMTVP